MYIHIYHTCICTCWCCPPVLLSGTGVLLNSSPISRWLRWKRTIASCFNVRYSSSGGTKQRTLSLSFSVSLSLVLLCFFIIMHDEVGTCMIHKHCKWSSIRITNKCANVKLWQHNRVRYSTILFLFSYLSLNSLTHTLNHQSMNHLPSHPFHTLSSTPTFILFLLLLQ